MVANKLVDAKGKSFEWFVENVWGSDDRKTLRKRLDYLIRLREQQEKGINTLYKDYNLVYEKELIYSIGI